MEKRIVGSLIIAFLITILSFSQGDVLEISCYVETQGGDPISSAQVEIYQGATKVKTVSTDGKGMATFNLDYNKGYKVIITKGSMIQKRIDFQTNISPENQRKLRKEFAVSLAEDCEGADVGVFKEPADIITYDEGFGNFVSDDAHFQKMQSRFANAYQSLQKCKQDKFDSKKQEGDNLFAQGNYEEAIKQYEEALKVFPNDGSTKRAITAAQKNIEKNNANSVKYDQYVKEGEQFLAQKNLAAARQSFAQAQKLMPGESLPQTKITQIDAQIAEQAAALQQQQAVQKEYDDLVKQGNSAMAAQNFALAQQAYEKAAAIKPNDSYSTQRAAEAQKALTQQQEKQAEEERINKEYESIMAQAQAAMQQGDYVKAQATFQSALAIKPSASEPRKFLEEAKNLEAEKQKQLLAQKQAEIEQNYTDAIGKADALMAQKSYTEAITAYKEAQSIKPHDPYPQKQIGKANNLIVEEAQAKQAAIENQYNSAIASGDAQKIEKNFAEAIIAYQQALAVKPSDPAATSKLAEAEKLLADKQRKEKEEQETRASYLEYIQQADAMFQSMDYNNSKEKYNQALALYGSEQYPKNQIAKIDNILERNKKEAEYNQAIASADAFFDQKKWADAKAEYNKAQLVLPENAYPRQRINEINQQISNDAKAQVEAEFNEFIAQAEQQVTQKNFEEAKALLNRAQTVIPENPLPQKRINEINQLISQEAKDAKLAEYNNFVAQAEEQVSLKNYDQAKAFLSEAQKVQPENPLPQKRINEINELISNSAKAKELAEFEELRQQAEQLVIQKKYAEAKAIYAEAQKVQPENPLPQKRINEINELISNTAKAEELAEFEELRQQAEQLVIQKNYTEAKAIYAEAQKVQPENPLPQKRINEINELISNSAKVEELAKFEELRQQAEQLVTQKNYKEAKAIYAEAQKVQPENPYPQQRINEINLMIDNAARNDVQTQYNELIAKADGLFEIKSYVDAKLTYQQAKGVIPTENYPQQQINTINKLLSENKRKNVEADYDGIIANADRFFEQKSYNQATIAYKKALTVMPEQTYPQQKINEISAILTEIARQESQENNIEQNYLNTIALADKYFSDKNYPLATQEYTKALNIKSTETYPQTQIEKIKELVATEEARKAQILALERSYKEAIAKADELFKARSYTSAKTEYQNALSYKESDVHATSQIQRIEQLLTAEQAAQQKQADKKAQYDRFITGGDRLYNTNQLVEARQAYQSALDIIPGQEYPQSQVRKINEKFKTLAASQAAANKASTTVSTTTKTTTTPTTNTKKENLSNFSFNSDSERENYLSSLKEKYKEGITKETHIENNSTTYRYIVIRKGEVNEYRETYFKWGGKQYRVNGKPTNSLYISQQVRPRDGESFIEVK